MLGLVRLEISVAVLGIIIIFLELLLPKVKKKLVGYIAILSILFILALSFTLNTNKVYIVFNGTYILDSFSLYLKQMFLFSGLIITLMSLTYSKKLENRAEFFALIIFAILGMMVLTSAHDLITLYVGLELMTITFIILTAFNTSSFKSTESGMKYIILSAMSSAVLLYGMSLLYGLTGSTLFSDIVTLIYYQQINPLMIFAIIAIIAGFGFKVSMVPFHMWVPDIYEGAPTPITAFLVIGSKVAGFAALFRILFQAVPTSFIFVVLVIAVLAALTIIIGNLIAIPQENVKRLLAYSSIAHAGYIMLGLISFSSIGLGAALYYIPVYILANTGAFAAIMAASSQEDRDLITDYSGMWKRSPLISTILLISLVSLAGIPPAAGFLGKFYLFISLIRYGYTWLAALALGMSVVSVYYYMNFAKVVVVKRPEFLTPIKTSFSLKVAMIISASGTLFLGIYPGPALEWSTKVANEFLGITK